MKKLTLNQRIQKFGRGFCSACNGSFVRNYHEDKSCERCKKERFGKTHCVICGVEFLKKAKTHLTCSEPCRKERHKKLYNKTEGKNTTKKSDSKKWHQIKPGNWKTVPHSKKDEDQRESLYKNRRGYYVYIWFDGDIPFYVGKGTGQRHSVRHMADYASSFAERRKRVAKNFKCKIVRDNLTQEGALLVEATTIETLRALGLLLTNQGEPMKRQEKPPLEVVPTIGG